MTETSGTAKTSTIMSVGKCITRATNEK